LADDVYEGMFIFDSNRYGHDPEAVSGQVNSTIQKLGGEILVSRLWEERRLAFPIKSHRKGTYWLTYFRLAGPQLTTLKREFQINENILRALFLRSIRGLSTPWSPRADRARRGSPRRRSPAPAVVSRIAAVVEDIEVPELDEDV